MTPMKAIRAKCLDCMCGSAHEVRLCPVTKCPLYVYRFGKRPKVGKDTGKELEELNTPLSPLMEDSERTQELYAHERL